MTVRRIQLYNQFKFSSWAASYTGVRWLLNCRTSTSCPALTLGDLPHPDGKKASYSTMNGIWLSLVGGLTPPTEFLNRLIRMLMRQHPGLPVKADVHWIYRIQIKSTKLNVVQRPFWTKRNSKEQVSSSVMCTQSSNQASLKTDLYACMGSRASHNRTELLAWS